MLAALVLALTALGKVAVGVDKVTLPAALGRGNGPAGLDVHMAIRLAVGAGAGMVRQLALLAGREYHIGVQHALAGMICKSCGTLLPT